MVFCTGAGPPRPPGGRGRRWGRRVRGDATIASLRDIPPKRVYSYPRSLALHRSLRVLFHVRHHGCVSSRVEPVDDVQRASHGELSRPSLLRLRLHLVRQNAANPVTGLVSGGRGCPAGWSRELTFCVFFFFQKSGREGSSSRTVGNKLPESRQ